MHEQSETIQLPNGRWVNVYGKALPNAGKQLPGTPDYASVEEAVKAAKERSAAHPHEELRRQKGLSDLLRIP